MRRVTSSLLVFCLTTVAWAQSGKSADAKAGYPLVLNPGDPQSKNAPRYSPHGRQLKLEAKDFKKLAGFDHLEARLNVGPNIQVDAGHLLVLARSAKRKPYDLLFVDVGGTGKLNDKPITTTPSSNRGKFWSSFQTIIRVRHGKPGDKAMHEEYPIALWIVVEKENETPSLIRVSRRGYLTGEAKIGAERVEVVLSDSNNDGVFGTGDWWELRGKTEKGVAMRTVGDFAWAAGKAWKLELEGTNGRKARLAPFDPGLTEAEDAIRRDRLREDRLAKRAEKPVAFRKDVDAALKELAKKKQTYFIKFETDWCIPCKQMTEFVFTAKDVVNAADGITCIIVDGDTRKDLVEKHKVKGYPTGILFDADGAEIARYVGYQSVKETTAFFRKTEK